MNLNEVIQNLFSEGLSGHEVEELFLETLRQEKEKYNKAAEEKKAAEQKQYIKDEYFTGVISDNEIDYISRNAAAYSADISLYAYVQSTKDKVSHTKDELFEIWYEYFKQQEEFNRFLINDLTNTSFKDMLKELDEIFKIPSENAAAGCADSSKPASLDKLFDTATMLKNLLEKDKKLAEADVSTKKASLDKEKVTFVVDKDRETKGSLSNVKVNNDFWNFLF